MNKSVGVEKHMQRQKNSKGKGHPVMFGLPEAEHFGDFPDGGGYPHRFLYRAYEILGVTDVDAVLHVCSGSMRVGICVDVRVTTNPTLIADGCHLPFRDCVFDWVMADPPYSREYAENLYETGDFYPSPHVLAQECIRVLRVGGRLGFMHHMVPKVKKPGNLLKVYTITQGMGYNVRAWSVFEKRML